MRQRTAFKLIALFAALILALFCAVGCAGIERGPDGVEVYVGIKTDAIFPFLGALIPGLGIPADFPLPMISLEFRSGMGPVGSLYQREVHHEEDATPRLHPDSLLSDGDWMRELPGDGR